MWLSQLLAKTAARKGFVLAKAGKPIARVTAIDSSDAAQQKRLGFMKGQFEIPENFDRMDQDEITDMFEG